MSKPAARPTKGAMTELKRQLRAARRELRLLQWEYRSLQYERDGLLRRNANLVVVIKDLSSFDEGSAVPLGYAQAIRSNLGVIEHA